MNEFNQPSPEEMQFLQRYFFNGSEDIESQSLSCTEPPAHNIHEFTDYPPGYLAYTPTNFKSALELEGSSSPLEGERASRI